LHPDNAVAVGFSEFCQAELILRTVT